MISDEWDKLKEADTLRKRNPGEDKKPGDHCTVNGVSDLACDGEARGFIGEHCVYIKTTKAGLIQIHKINEPLSVITIPKRNYVSMPKDVDTAKSLEERYGNAQFIVNPFSDDMEVVDYYDIRNWILNNGNLVEDILKEGEK